MMSFTVYVFIILLYYATLMFVSLICKDKKKIVETDTSLTVYARVDDRSKLEAERVQKRSSIMLHLHQNTYHSLALIKLNEAIHSDKGTEPASVTNEGVINVEDNICSTGSYGNTGSYGSHTGNNTTMKYMYFYLKTCKCHNEVKEIYHKELMDKWVCGQLKLSQKICQGDFGLGLMCDGYLQAVCIGVVVFADEKSCRIIEEGSLCEDEKSMALFVDVCYYLEWIRSFVPTVDGARFNCDSRSDANTATPILKWVISLFSLIIFRFKNNFCK